MGETGYCSKSFKLVYGHEGVCICRNSQMHICSPKRTKKEVDDKKCFLYKIAGGCNENCSLKYGHQGKHRCDVE